jgi:hypothetical protein
MRIGKLPLATSKTTVGRALELMRDRGVSGIAVPREHTISLVGYGDLIAGEFAPRVRVASLEPIRLAPRLTSDEIKKLKLTRPQRAPSSTVIREFEKFMVTRGYFYAALGSDDDELAIASVFELGLEPYLVRPKSCYCTNTYTPHPYDNGSHGKTCKQDGSPIVCS